ncbi:MAG: chromosome segregation protein SMC, partial [Treponema sp.]|nr:chromosome segregation protein SMC [Treponema sp.]
SVKDDVFNNELDITLLKLKNKVQDKARNEEQLKIVEQKRSQVRKEIEDITNTLSENMDKVKSMQENVYSKQSDLIGIQQEKNGKEALIKQFNERSTESKEKLEQLETHKSSIQDAITNLNEEIDEKNARVYESQKQLEDIKNNIASFDKNISDASLKIQQNEKTILDNKKTIDNLREKRQILQKDLAAITEDIVTKLDAKLKDAGFSENAMTSAKERLDSILGKLKIFTVGRKNIFSDFVSTGKNNLSENKNIANEALIAFSEAEKLVTELENALQNYVHISPAFITEFLSPKGIMTQKRSIDSDIQKNRDEANAILNSIDELSNESDSLSLKIDEYKETLNKLKVNEAKMAEQISASQDQLSYLRRSRAQQEEALRSTENDIQSENIRLSNFSKQIKDVQDEIEIINQKGQALAQELKKLDEEISQCNTSVSGKRNALQKKQDEQNKFQSQYERYSLELVSADTEIKNIKQNFQDTHSRDLMESEERMYKITKPIAEIKEALFKAKEELRLLGQVNLMAVEEFAEVK